MYGNSSMTCFKYQMYLYGSEAITYLNAIFWVVTELALWVIKLRPPFTTGRPPPLCMAALPSPIWKKTPVWLKVLSNENGGGSKVVSIEP